MAINTLRVMFVGAVNTVTGSCSLLEFTRENNNPEYFLVDCGQYQEEKGDLKSQSFLWNIAKKIKSVFLTHAHIDHVGLLPRLIDHGFNGKVYCTKATHELTNVMLRDLLSIEGKHHNEISNILNQINFCKLDERNNSIFGSKTMIPISTGLFLGVKRSSHILGSCSYFFSWKKDTDTDRVTSIHFSSDLGPVDSNNRPSVLMKQHGWPYFGEHNKFFVLESTYGNKIRDKQNVVDKRLDQLFQIIDDHLFNKSGKVLIPTFSLHRSQELLLDLYYICHNKPKQIGVQHRTLEDSLSKQVVFSYFDDSNFLPNAKEELTKIWIDYHTNLIKSDSPTKEDEKKYIKLLKEKYKTYINPKKKKKNSQNNKSFNEFVLSVLTDNDGNNYKVTYGNLPKDFLNNFYENQMKYANHVKEIYINYNNVVAYSPLIYAINNIYIDNLFDTYKKQNDTDITMKYLSDTFFKHFNIDTTNKLEAKKAGLDLLKNAFFPTLFQNKDVHRNNHIYISKKSIIVSSSGMCDNGSVLEIMPEILTDENNAIILTGYQVINTNGYLLKKLANNEITGDELYNTSLKGLNISLAEVKCKIYDLSQYYSGHADQEQLVEYILGLEDKQYGPNKYDCKVFLTHGTPDSTKALKEKIEEKNETKNVQVVIPQYNTWYNLNKNGEEEQVDVILEEPVTKKLLSVGDIDVIYPSTLTESKVNAIKTLLEKFHN